MLSAVNSVGISGGYVDSEHQRIIQQLIQMGITPTYNKSVDKSKLESAKTELIEKIQSNQQENYESDYGDEYGGYSEDEYLARAEMEEQRLGAMTLAELNRYFLVNA